MFVRIIKKIKKLFQSKNNFHDEQLSSLNVSPGTKINLGCGFSYFDGWVNWDIVTSVKADAYLNFGKDRFPSDDESVDCIYSNGVLEQLLKNEHFDHCINECNRILKPGGTFLIVVPNSEYPIAFRDPHDCRHMTPETFRYFCKGMKSYERYGKLYGYRPWTTFNHSTDERGLMTIRLKK